MTADDRDASLRQRLAAGEWLRTGEVAELFGTTRMSVHRWLSTGVMVAGVRRFPEYRVGPSGRRLLDPSFVTDLLTQTDRRRSASTDPDTGDAPSDR